MTICNKCVHLWKRSNKFYCTLSSFPANYNVAYSKSKKECKCFEKGENVRQFFSKSNKYR